MTPPILNAAPARVHRRSIPPTVAGAYTDRANQHRACLARREPVVVRVTGYGAGWYIQAVGDGVYQMWRDGTPLTAAWTDVPLGQ